VSRGGAILASLLVTIGRPAWWLAALAGFLVRGGFVAIILPIVLLPSPLALSNMVAPVLVPVALGRIGLEAIAIFGGAVVVLSAWILVGGWIGAATDLLLIREAAAAAADEGVGPRLEPAPAAVGDRAILGRLLSARLVALLPLAAAIAIGIVRIVTITYDELTRPVEVTTPLVFRVAAGAAVELIVIVVTWLLGDLVGGLAARRIVLDGAPPVSAVIAAAGDVLRRPRSTLGTWLVTSGLLVWILGGTIAAASIGWTRVIVVLSDRPIDSPAVAISVLLFVAIWLAALALGGLFAALRSSVQTFEYVRWRTLTGTFGASAHHRPGDWSIPDEGGSL
jgi:hypothetical protein